MARQLNCPCGTMIIALDDHLVTDVREHLREAHPGREYTDQEIWMISAPVPDCLAQD